MNIPDKATDVTVMEDWQIADFAQVFGFDADKVDKVLILPIGEEAHRVQFTLTFTFKHDTEDGLSEA